MTRVSVLIIGAGPIGLSCGIAAKKSGISYKIIDKGCLVNSIYNFPTDMTFFSSSEKLEIGDVPFTSLALRPSRNEALEYYRRVAEHHHLEIGLYESFESFKETNSTDSERFQVKTSKNNYSCDFIVNSTGFYGEAVLLNILGENLPKVNHYYTSAHHLFKQKVAVIGASNSAVDVALEAYRKGAEVTLLVRGEELSKSVKYWVRPDIEARIAEGALKVYFETEVIEVTESYVVATKNGKQFQMENDFVYAMTGYKPDLNLFKMFGTSIDDEKGAAIYNTVTMETDKKGVYIAGVACGGVNTREWFIENSRDHGQKIMDHIKGEND